MNYQRRSYFHNRTAGYQYYPRPPSPNRLNLSRHTGTVVNVPTDEYPFSGIIYAADYTGDNPRLFTIPRYIHDVSHIKAVWGPDVSKSKISQFQSVLESGTMVTFWADDETALVQKYEKHGKGHKSWDRFKLRQLDDRHTVFISDGVVSDEKVRRLVCPQFPDLPVPTGYLGGFHPNVHYVCTVKFTLNMCGYKPFMPLERFRPTYSIKFCHIVNATRTDESHRFIAGMEWNQERNLKLMKKAPRWYPPSMLPYTEENKMYNAFCVVISQYELYNPEYPNEKCVVAHPHPLDWNFVPGSIVSCKAYYCRINKVHIAYHYEGMKLHEENPMKIRRRDGHFQFLGYVKLNNLGHFYCTSAIPLVQDPNNVMHGHAQLGDQNAAFRDEKVPGVGTPVWLRFRSEKPVFRWEIVELLDLEKVPDHLEFTSVGLLLNRRGTVYCPHVCNFPLQMTGWNIDGKNWNADFKVEYPSGFGREAMDVGDWFSFRAKFVEETQRYQIVEVFDVERRKYPAVQLASEKDTFAFQLPIETFYRYARHVSLHEEIGFVEDVDNKFTMFLHAWQDHRNTMLSKRPRKVLSKKKKQELAAARSANPTKWSKEVRVWCRVNTDMKGHLTPLSMLDIEQPEGWIIGGGGPAGRR